MDALRKSLGDAPKARKYTRGKATVPAKKAS